MTEGSLPEPGAFRVDNRTGRIGRVMGSEGPYVQLRPVRGGVEWDVPTNELREPTHAEEMSVKVAVANGRWAR
ncbi:hypothetical protein ACJ6WF_22180 [Streptomyces sp. MMS24-I2-30]|uniref:hypothetical protein n=1 Tax=Streptomyces sp. MMS24-I2-30 TaxID=3351564 RepID=UPI00389699AE